MYEYKVVPAPMSAPRSLRFWVKQDQFISTVSDTMNELALEHWEYMRADKLPFRMGRFLRGRKQVRDVLVFRREVMRVRTTDAPQTNDAPQAEKFEEVQPAPTQTAAEPRERVAPRKVKVTRSEKTVDAATGRRHVRPSRVVAVGEAETMAQFAQQAEPSIIAAE